MSVGVLEKMRSALPGDTVWDRGERGSVKGLHLRVLPNGVKSFLLYYRTRQGTQRRPKIGEFPDTTLAEARKRARGMVDRVAIGEDPKADWDEARAELTIEELFEKTWAGHWEQPRYQRSGWAKEAKRLFEKHLKSQVGKLKLSELTVARIREWHERFRDKPYSGNRAIYVLSRMFAFAEEKELRAQGTNPCALVKLHPEKKRSRYASEDEIRKLAALLEKETEKNLAAGAFIYLLMYTGSRPRAIERATWEQLTEVEVDGKMFGILTFRGKSSETTGEDEKVILPPQVMAIVQRLPRLDGMTITGIKMPRRLWRRIKKEAGCEDLWARDWRRTFATVGMSNGVEIGMIGAVLNHRSQETTKTYAKVIPTRQVEVVRTIAGRLDSIIGAGKVKVVAG